MCAVSNVMREVRNSANGGQREVRLWHNCATYENIMLQCMKHNAFLPL